MDRYDIIERIGKGTYGTVFRAKDKQTNESVAIKTIELESEEGIPSTAIREIALLKWLKNPNVVSLHDVIHIHDKLYMVFELLELDLKHYLDVCPNGLQIPIVKSLLYQLLQGLSYCHKQRVLHRDLKPANILLNRAGQLKIADFGLARSFALPVSTLKHEVITLWYRSPELLLGSTTYGTEVDMWSIGCIFAEMLTCVPLFNGGTDEAQIELIFSLCGAPIINEESMKQATIRNNVNNSHQPTANPDIEQNNPGAHLDMQTMARPGVVPDDFNKDDLGGYIASLPLFSKFRPLICDNPKVKTPYDPMNIVNSLPQHALQDPHCLDLLSKLLALDPTKRVTAEQAMTHPFFDDAKAKKNRQSSSSSSTQHASTHQNPQQQQPHHQQQLPPQQISHPADMHNLAMQQQQHPNMQHPQQQPQFFQQPQHHPQQQQQQQPMYQQQPQHQQNYQQQQQQQPMYQQQQPHPAAPQYYQQPNQQQQQQQQQQYYYQQNGAYPGGR